MKRDRGRPGLTVLKLAAIPVLLLAVTMPAADRTAQAQDGLEQILDAVVGLRAEIPASARTARFLGTEREGHGVLIDDNGLIVTIGYLILEANRVYITTRAGRTYPAEVVAYDSDTGFGLVRSVIPLKAKPLALGDASNLREEDPVVIVHHGDSLETAVIVSRRTFTGYWEYLLEDAIFTAPPTEAFAGAALIDKDFRLVGIGYLFVRNAAGEGISLPGNMFVPIENLAPIIPDLVAHGRSSSPAKPWLGIFTADLYERVIVTRVIDDGPAGAAGLGTGDIVLEVGGKPVASQEEFYRALWDQGAAGVTVSMKVLQKSTINDVRVKSIDRYQYFRMHIFD